MLPRQPALVALAIGGNMFRVSDLQLFERLDDVLEATVSKGGIRVGWSGRIVCVCGGRGEVWVGLPFPARYTHPPGLRIFSVEKLVWHPEPFQSPGTGLGSCVFVFSRRMRQE